jgi:branched-chain amino acid transport system substrate-binding protein
MKKMIMVMIGMCLLLPAFVFGTGQSESGDIVIGLIQDLSGPTSVWGNAVKKGAEVAVEEINNNGGVLGRNIVLKAYDVKLDPQQAINSYNRLVDQDKAVAVVGPPISNIGLSLTALSEAKKVPIVGSFMDPRVTVGEDGKARPFMFLMQPTSDQYSEILADYALKEIGVKKVAVMYDQSNAFSVSLVKPFVAYIEANGGSITTQEVYRQGDKDFRTQLNKIKNSGPEAVFLPNYVQDSVITLQQMDQIGLDIPIIGALDFAPPFASLMGDPKMADNIFFANNYSDNEPQLIKARMAYVDKFNEEPINKAYLGYDKILIIADAIERAGSSDPVAVAEALGETTDLQGATGLLSISPETHQPLGLSMVMYMIREGDYVDLGRHVPESHK